MKLGEVAAVLTAAGLSSRMGSPKALLNWHGRPLIAHQLAQLAGCGQVIVVLGHAAEAIRPHVPPEVTVVVNPDYASGRVGSLRAGFAAVHGKPGGVLVVGVDQPLAPGVVEKLAADMATGAAIAVPSFEGKRGHPVLFRGDLLPELLDIREETQGLREVVQRHKDARQEVPVASDWILADLNRPEDWARLTGRSPDASTQPL